MSCFRVGLEITPGKQCAFTGDVCRFTSADNAVFDVASGRSHVQISEGSHALASIILEQPVRSHEAEQVTTEIIQNCGGASELHVGKLATRCACPIDGAAHWDILPNRKPNAVPLPDPVFVTA